MRYQIFFVAALSLCLLIAPAWAMDDAKDGFPRATQSTTVAAVEGDNNAANTATQSDDFWSYLQKAAVYKCTMLSDGLHPATVRETQVRKDQEREKLHGQRRG